MQPGLCHTTWAHILPWRRLQHQPPTSSLVGDPWWTFSPSVLAYASYNQAWYVVSSTRAAKEAKRHDRMTEMGDLFIFVARKVGSSNPESLTLAWIWNFVSLFFFSFFKFNVFPKTLLSQCSNSYRFQDHRLRFWHLRCLEWARKNLIPKIKRQLYRRSRIINPCLHLRSLKDKWFWSCIALGSDHWMPWKRRLRLWTLVTKTMCEARVENKEKVTCAYAVSVIYANGLQDSALLRFY